MRYVYAEHVYVWHVFMTYRNVSTLVCRVSQPVLADRIGGLLTVALMLQCYVCRLSSSSVTLCIVAKRCVLEHKSLLTAYRKSYEPILRHIYLLQYFDTVGWVFWPVIITYTVLAGTLNTAHALTHYVSHSAIRHWVSRKPLEIEPWFQRTINRGIKWSRDRWRHMTSKGQVVIPIRLESNISKTAGDAI